MEMIADIMLGAGAIGAGFYCIILGRRLNRFNNLEKGVGGAVAVLSAQVDDLTKTLDAAQTAAGRSAETLQSLVERAEQTARTLEMHLASLHDIAPSEPPKQEPETLAKTPPESSPSNPPDAPMFTRRHIQNGAG